ncbi:phenolphthiocerol/phthiocerol polyketide synthase subunit C-like [Nematostella vectensis]|nr:phenolphthiocerol/phthiocerol polyketide synthase subunit C-like [Nematostella vectensis]
MILYSSEGQIHEFASNSGCIAFSGLVTEVGSRRSRFKPSNKVCGIITPCRVGEKIRVKEVHLLIQPEVFTEVQAAAFPYCIVIACKVLDRSLSGKTSPTVLIHEAQTGLGYTTAAIAAAMGHKTVCSTTQLGNESTRRILQNAGIEGIVDVSCLDLEDECKAKFDAVLFLSSPKPGAMKRSLSSLKHDGKLVVACEDFTGQAILSGRSSICYDRIRPSELLMGTNESFEEMWLSCQSMLMRTGVLQKLLVVPQETTSVYRAVKKWNSEEKWPQQEKRSTIYRMFMFDKNERPCAQIPGLDIFGLKRDRTYMVAGGVRGFGFQLAQSFAENGAKTVVLLARSPPSEEKKKVVQEIERRTGARMIMEQVDLSSETQMKTLELKLKGLPSMAGIVHTAVVLHDAFVHNMELDSFKKVLAPKLRGAFLLHKMSLQMDLDFFVLFSSLASVMGGRGQSAYSAANAFLDSLAGYRRHTLGLPGLAINWGPIGGAGILTRELKIANLHAEYGFGLLDAELGSKFLIEILKCQPSRCQVTLAEIDWVQFFKTSDESARSTRVKSLRSEVEDKSERHTDETASLASRILFQTDTTKREHLIEEFVMSTLARCFELDSFSEADRTTSLYAFGADSITALTLKAAFETSLQMSFEVFYFLQPEISAVKIVRDLQEMMSNPENQQEIQQQQHTAFVKTIEQEDTTLMSPLSFNDSSNGANDSEKDTVKVVPIYAPEDAEVKFFCIHPSHRYVMSVAPFASGFRSQTLVAMYSIGFTEPVYHGADCSSVRELASHYVSLVREEQKHGPYFLGGYCFGGLVAYEMACILTEQGESVGFVGMIDTYVWLPPSGGFGRFSSYFLQDFDPEKQVEIRMESYLSRIAINNLAMKEEEYQRMRAEHSISDVMDLLQQRSCDLDKPLYNLKDMRDNLHHDIVTSRKRQDEWEPAKVQYEGPVLYIRCEDPKYCPVLWHYKSSDRAWEDVLPGPVDVCMCPGDHFSLGLLPEARPVGMIMVNSISFRYRTLFPELYPLELDYKHRRAIRTYLGGIPVVLYGENGKGCKTGKVSLKREKQELCFMSSSRRSRNIGIPLKDVRSVLPGKYVTHATRKWARKSLDHLLQDLGNVVSVFANRTYDFQFSSIEDTQMFVLLTEALFNVNIADMF